MDTYFWMRDNMLVNPQGSASAQRARKWQVHLNISIINSLAANPILLYGSVDWDSQSDKFSTKSNQGRMFLAEQTNAK